MRRVSMGHNNASLDPTPDLLNKVSVVQQGPMRFTFLVQGDLLKAIEEIM